MTFTALVATAVPETAAVALLVVTMAAATPAINMKPPNPPNIPAIAPLLTGGVWALH